MFLFSLAAYADQLVSGNELRVYYDGIGTWNDADSAAGLQVANGGSWVDWTYAGYPWQTLAVEYTAAGTAYAAYANSNIRTTTFSVVAEEDLSTDTTAVARYSYTYTGLELEQTQGWMYEGRVMRVGYALDAARGTLDALRLTFIVDPDPDYVSSVYTTTNDTLDTDGDGLGDLVTSAGALGYVLAFGACDPAISELGHIADWSSSYDADQTLTDDAAATADAAMGIRMTPDGGVTTEGAELVFLVLAGDTLAEVEDLWAESAELCAPCDADADGYDSAVCGGEDCDDGAAEAHPGAAETWYDGVDGDCDGADDYDADADGYTVDLDCDDTDESAYPGAEDAWYDGVDADCDGASDYDADLDGADTDLYGGADCDDTDPSIGPEASEIWYDDIDQNCDDNDDDADGDGFDVPLDCDDTSASVYPGAGGVPGDGVDSDCDGADTDVSTDPGADDINARGECGCAAGSGAGWGAALLAAAMLRRRGRRCWPGSRPLAMEGAGTPVKIRGHDDVTAGTARSG